MAIRSGLLPQKINDSLSNRPLGKQLRSLMGQKSKFSHWALFHNVRDDRWSRGIGSVAGAAALIG